MNKYEIVGIVGEGAFGIVYKAKNKDNGEFGKSKHSNLYIIYSGHQKNKRKFRS